MTYLWGNPGLAFHRELLTFQCGLPSFWERCASSSAQVTCSSRWPSEDAKCLFLWAAMVTVREVGQPRTGTLASYLWQSSLSLYSAPASPYVHLPSASRIPVWVWGCWPHKLCPSGRAFSGLDLLESQVREGSCCPGESHRG